MMREKHMLDPRRAGQVLRYHTWPQLRGQSTGEHTWQVIRVLLAIWPAAPRHVIVHAVGHDVGELATGDLPYPTKSLDPDLKRRMDTAERDAHLCMSTRWSLPAPVALTEQEHLVFKLAEFIEMLEWALFEINLGNRYAALVQTRVELGISAILHRMSEQVASRITEAGHFTDVLARADTYMKKRVETEKEIHDER